MRSRARVPDREATVLVLVSTDARIRSRAVWLVELRSWNVRTSRPERFGCGQIASFVEIQASMHALLVNDGETAKPHAEKPHHLRVAVREPNFTVGRRTLARVERNAGREERFIAQYAEAFPSLAVQVGYLAELCFV